MAPLTVVLHERICVLLVGIIVQIVAAPAAACSPDPPIRCPAPPDSQAQILVIVIVLFVIVLFRFMLDDLLEQRACPWLRGPCQK